VPQASFFRHVHFIACIAQNVASIRGHQQGRDEMQTIGLSTGFSSACDYVEHDGRMYFVEYTVSTPNVFRLRADWTNGRELSVGGNAWNKIVSLAGAK
jgi:hypothetical protein